MRTLLLLLSLSLPSLISAKANKNMPKILLVDSANYFLCKEHTIKYAYVIKIAYVGLYLQDCKINDNLLTSADKLIRFNYQVNVKAEVFIDAAEEYFLKNINPLVKNQKVNDQILTELKKFNTHYENIKAYEYYDLYHKQGRLLKLIKNSKTIGISNNKSFSYRYFNIWFGDKPAVKKLKKSFMNS
jgi:hypothetical protein